ncbi:MAG TPA: molybdopterin-binding protein [Methanospirillum sp.]|uniref:molybdenum cofactor synthesis domain-containing protein n=1 Tax=Methanospirillum sp. TaxID=45200 RepID=UPI002BD64DC4|nr:molybdopterin-binding protein [Methanospirillum sp.]HWQ65181.1 molybdopterin-binding protein [Methanospirillum sp.]
MKRYLSKIPLPEAITILTTTFPQPDRREFITAEEANGRVLASPVYANATIPAARLASMDGIAVRSQETLEARDQNPVVLTNAVSISTGQVVPTGYDAVIASEEIGFAGDGRYEIRRPARMGQNIREPGEEVKSGRLILHPGHRVVPSDLGALITYGIREVEVRSLVIGLIPTGDELVQGDQEPKPGQVRESNTAVIAASLIQAGITPVRYPITPDDPDLIRNVISSAVQSCDLVLISAGSSGGSRDHTREVIEELGSILFHGVAMRPGKTILCGNVENTPVIGLPGQPMASLTAWREIVIPLLRSWEFNLQQIHESSAITAEPIPSDGGIDEFIPVSVVRILGEDYVFPRPRGAAGQMQAVRSNAVLHIPAVKEGYREGAPVTVRLTRQHRDEQGILIAGISDTLTDLLQATFISHKSHLIIRPLSAIGAAAALCKGMCHGIFISGSATGKDSDISRLLQSGCRDQVRSVAVGFREGESIMLLFRDTPPVLAEISPLIDFLSSEIWRKAIGLPEPGISGTVEPLVSEPGNEYSEQTTGHIQRIRS